MVGKWGISPTYKWGIPWGYNPLILTIDPNFQRDIPPTKSHLSARQGEIHFFSEVGGMTYFLLPLRRHRTH